jgi:hypothetical protein
MGPWQSGPGLVAKLELELELELELVWGLCLESQRCQAL